MWEARLAFSRCSGLRNPPLPPPPRIPSRQPIPWLRSGHASLFLLFLLIRHFQVVRVLPMVTKSYAHP
jgi:hypothetical protein